MREGETAGNYRILKPLGKGGEGSVWLAVHIKTCQLWAVKEISKKDGEQEFHELKVMRRFRHPSLPRMIDVVETENSILLVMEYIRGISLERWMRQKGHLSEEETIDAALQVISALAYLHSRKPPLLHLDIKPANVIRKKNGKLILVDFGASRHRMRSHSPDEDKRLGTRGFAAPEQYDPDCPLSERTDIYGLGAMMYYMISGLLYSSALKKGKVPGCSDHLGNIIRKAIRERPEERFSDVREMELALVRMKRLRERSRRGKQALLAALLMTVSVILAGTALQDNLQELSRTEWDYDRILKEALCAPPEEALKLYLRACFMDPKRAGAYDQFLLQLDQDQTLTQAEEINLRELLHTIAAGSSRTYEEELAADPEKYSSFAFRTGMVYWYDYEAPELIRRQIASGWFSKALTAAKTSGIHPDWEETGEIFYHMGTIPEDLEKVNEQGGRSFVFQYWQDLQRLLGKELSGEMTLRMRRKLYEDSVDFLISYSGALTKEGISADEKKNLLNVLSEKIDGKDEEKAWTGEKDHDDPDPGAERRLKEKIHAAADLADNLEKEKGVSQTSGSDRWKE